MDCLFSSQGNSLNVKKKYGMIKDRTEKDTLVTEVLDTMEQYKQEFIEFMVDCQA